MADQLPKLTQSEPEQDEGTVQCLEVSRDIAHQRRLVAYIQAALMQAVYEELADDGSIYAEIPGFQGVWANAPTQEECRAELAEVLEGWLILRLDLQRPIPVVNDIDLIRDAVV